MNAGSGCFSPAHASRAHDIACMHGSTCHRPTTPTARTGIVVVLVKTRKMTDRAGMC